ncbi:hypothetical protein O6H91_23G036900 [Diphasiastrum complanatum]|uniref:Uncharacterized protein n=2 Tax=Diphasiastrum complanatum TaxID=34168 RepID=A0ACC2A9S1_DIPCM|nr:hypothetical protein O6H91_23G036800 [Diphasiastrum complanatum]KAJ7514283.1 hypothetical protein O6H91_23G036900 [Diphasiastrum complanatum]
MKFSYVILCSLMLLYVTYQQLPRIWEKHAIMAGSLSGEVLHDRSIFNLEWCFRELHERIALDKALIHNLHRKLAEKVAKEEKNLNFEPFHPAPTAVTGQGRMEDLHYVPSTPNPIQNGYIDDSRH